MSQPELSPSSPSESRAAGRIAHAVKDGLDRLLLSIPTRPRGRERLPMFVAIAAGLACLLALAHRSQYAPDLSDEGFSIAMPYRFALGDRPFVDEVSIQQTAGILVVPFVWLYLKLTGGSAGLVLFMRFLHFFFKGLAALAIYATGKRWLKHRSVAIAVAFVVFSFVPYSIPNTGYNLLGMAFLTAGCFLTAAAVAEPRADARFRLLVLAGMCESFMAFAYPPLALATAVATPLLLICTPDRRLHALAAWVMGGAIGALAIAPSLAFGGLKGVQRSLGWGGQEKGADGRLKAVLLELWHGVPAFYTYALIAVALAWLLRSRLLVAIVVPAITIAIVMVYRMESTSFWASNGTVTYGGAIAPALLVLAKPNAAVWRGSLLVVLPSYAAAAAAAAISTNGQHAACLGLLPMIVLFALLAARALERASADPVFCMAPAFTLTFVLCTRFYDFVYRDVPLASETEIVRSGPFRGIHTNPDRAEQLEELTRIAKLYDQPNGKILVLYEAPGVYLASAMRPSASCVWEVSYGSQDLLLGQWQAYPKGHGIVVRVKGSASGAIDKIVMPPERKLLETRHFIVYRDG